MMPTAWAILVLALFAVVVLLALLVLGLMRRLGALELALAVADEARRAPSGLPEAATRPSRLAGTDGP